jgi:hypothetical protein
MNRGVKFSLKKNWYIPYIAAFLTGALYFLFQFHHIQRLIDWDQIVYANNIIAALKPRSIVMFNSHHLHMEIGGKWFHEMVIHFFKKSGFTDVVFNNRLRSVLFASIGIFFIILCLKEITGKLTWGILGGILAGFCHGYLSYATKVDTAIYPAAGMALFLWLFFRLERAGRWCLFIAFPAGFTLFLCVMFHQYMGIACIVSVLALCLPSRLFPDFPVLRPFSIKRPVRKPEIDISPKKRYSAVFVMAFTALLFIAGAYFYAGETVYNLPFSKEETRRWRGPFGNRVFQNWVMGYAVEHTWGKGFKKFNPRNPIYGYTRSFVSSVSKKPFPAYDWRYYYNMKKPFDAYKLTHNLAGYFFLIILLGSLLFFPFLWKRYKRGFLLVVLSLILFSLFSTYWESYYYEFWLVPCLLSCVLGIMLFNFLGERLYFLLKRCAHYPFYALILVFTFFIGMHNVQYCAVPYSRNQVLGGISARWPKRYYMNIFSTYIYKNPADPYADVYHH